MYEIFTGCTNNNPPIYTLASDTGYIDMVYHYYYDGILNIYSVISPSLFILPPLGHISYDYSCSTPHEFLFHSNAIGADSIIWDFGDGNILDTGNVHNPLHNYVDTGDYVVMLEMHNYATGCMLIDSFTVYVRDIFANFEIPSFACAMSPVDFNAETSEDVFIPCFSGYEWDFGDDSPVISNDTSYALHHYTQGGTYYVELTVKDINGCIEHHYDTIDIYDINANLSYNPTIVCVPDSVVFTDLSWADTTIASWAFYPGFGDSLSSIPNFFYYDTLPISNNLPIYLTVTDVMGCQDSWSGMLLFSSLNPNIIASDYDICPGDQTIISVNAGYFDIMWYIEDSISYVGEYFTHQFDSAGLYDVSIVLMNSMGCHDSIVVTDFINVHPIPEVYITSDPSEDTLCLPVQITFTDASIVDYFGYREWDFYNSATINPDANVTWPYELPGTYQVSLTVTSAYGCANSTTKTFTVDGPFADFELYPPVICQGEEITVQLIDTSNVVSWMWDFGDGVVDSSQTGQLTYTYQPNYYPSGGQTFVSLIYYSETCQNTESINVIFYPEVLASFISPDNPDFIICKGESIELVNVSSNADIISWSFGDGYSSIDSIVTHSYPVAGNFPITLSASENTHSCEDDSIRILEVRDDAVVIAPDATICLGNSYALNVTSEGGISSYHWTPEDEFLNPYESNPIVTITETQTFQVEIVDGYGCPGIGSQTVIVISDPPAINWDTTVIIGESVHLDAWFGNYIDYTWVPDITLDNYFIYNPWAFTTDDNTYTVTLIDTVTNCFDVEHYYTIYIKPETSIDLPTVFTPNGDGVNDLFMIQGWGIKEVEEFKIYNRWGELVYEGYDKDSGWDGTYKGKDQPNDTYIYVAKVKTWLDQTLTKKGYVNLIR